MHGWISLHKLPTGKQMKAVWFPKVLTSPNSQQKSPKHRHREPLTLGHRSSKGPMFRWKSASEEQEAPNPKDSALRQRKRTTRLPCQEPFGCRQPLVSSVKQVNGPKSQAASQISVRNMWMIHPNHFCLLKLETKQKLNANHHKSFKRCESTQIGSLLLACVHFDSILGNPNRSNYS